MANIARKRLFSDTAIADRRLNPGAVAGEVHGSFKVGRLSVGAARKGRHFRRLKRRQRRRRENPIGGVAVQTLYQLLNGRDQRYSGSLQLFASENSLGTRSCPQIFRPARFGHRTKWSFRSLKYRSIASLAASAEG